MTTTAIDRGLGAELAADLAAAAFTLAKRFAAGATMWSIAPSWEPHALHIAVEFVHPVIMGKRALPAVALTGPNLIDLVRVSVRPGDIVIGVGGADDAQVFSVMRRSPAWGAATIWIGSAGNFPDDIPDDAALVILLRDEVNFNTGGTQVIRKRQRSLPALRNAGPFERPENRRRVMRAERNGDDARLVAVGADEVFDAGRIGQIERHPLPTQYAVDKYLEALALAELTAPR